MMLTSNDKTLARLLGPLFERAATMGLSDRRLSLEATGTDRAMKNIRLGHSPQIKTLEALCQAVGLEVVLQPIGAEASSTSFRSDEENKNITGEVAAKVVGYLRDRGLLEHVSNDEFGTLVSECYEAMIALKNGEDQNTNVVELSLVRAAVKKRGG